MNAAEKFKVTIDFIEELIQDEEKRSSDIGEIVAKKNGRSPRDMSTIFGYLMLMRLGLPDTTTSRPSLKLLNGSLI